MEHSNNIIFENDKIEQLLNQELERKRLEKQEIDLKEDEVEEIQKKTNLIFKGNIGYGGFSTVKLAFSEKNKNYYAVKIINLNNPKKFKKKTMSKRKDFVNQEILINYNSKHHNIVKLYGYFNFKQYYLLVMEFLHKKDLKTFLKKFYKKNDSMSEILAAFFLIEIIKGLKYLKSTHVIHRDIKPENVMVSHDYTAKIGDFSLSRKIDLDKKFITSRSGTVPYLAPEALKDKSNTVKGSHTERMDIFSLGILLYYMIFNEHPFNYKNGMSYDDYFLNLKHSPSYFSIYCTGISSHLKNLMEGMLNKNILKRYSIEQISNHPWMLICTNTINEIRENYSFDPDKMIIEFNKIKFNDIQIKEEFAESAFELSMKETKLLGNKHKI